ncbi:hypothetical protein ACFVVU_30735 [Kitasatospora sp. NPDC057965]|uniref:hypothetical protein n=1 Tax=Kitasatospora sp. NPDC057965 TaxID=3346291 RepID=UPI0036D78388
MEKPLTPADRREPTALLTCDLAEESEQVQALARTLELPHHARSPQHLLANNLLHTLVHLATTAASAAAVVDAADPLTGPPLTALSRIESALQPMLSAVGAMTTVLDQLAEPDSTITDTAGLVQAGRLRAGALLTGTAAHLGAAAAALRTSPGT